MAEYPRGGSLCPRRGGEVYDLPSCPACEGMLGRSESPHFMSPFSRLASELDGWLPGRFLPPLALALSLGFRHRPLVLIMLLARPLSLAHRIAPFVLKAPPLPRRLGRLVLWLFLVYVHDCKFVVCLAAIVRMARFGWLLARSWLCCAVGCLSLIHI